MPHESANNVVITFGAFKGYTLAHIYTVRPSYLKWLMDTPGIPDIWKHAAKLTLEGGDLTPLKLARANSVQTTTQKKVSTSPKVTIYLKDKKMAVVEMPYNPELMAKFKYEVDGRTWNAKDKTWEFPIVHLPKAFKVFGEENVKCDESVLNALESLKERRSDLDEIREKREDEEFQKKLYNKKVIGRVISFDKLKSDTRFAKFIRK